MRDDRTLRGRPACPLCGDDDPTDLYPCGSCRVEACGCCIGVCEDCGGYVCCECAVPDAEADPWCPRCAAPPGHPLRDPDRFLTPPERNQAGEPRGSLPALL